MWRPPKESQCYNKWPHPWNTNRPRGIPLTFLHIGPGLTCYANGHAWIYLFWLRCTERTHNLHYVMKKHITFTLLNHFYRSARFFFFNSNSVCNKNHSLNQYTTQHWYNTVLIPLINNSTNENKSIFCCTFTFWLSSKICCIGLGTLIILTFFFDIDETFCLPSLLDVTWFRTGHHTEVTLKKDLFC